MGIQNAVEKHARDQLGNLQLATAGENDAELDTVSTIHAGTNSRHSEKAQSRSGGGSDWPGFAKESPPSIAVLLPCHNEEATIAKVVSDFRTALPTAAIYVYDNASTDQTGDMAAAAGAISRQAPVLGKGNVLRRMFAEIEATVYVLADGDDTYDAAAAPLMVRSLQDHHLDMVVGRRVESEAAQAAYRPGHRLGNRLLSRSVHWLFGNGAEDMLSGYRVFSRRYVKSFPAHSRGFEAETEMTVHALELRLPFEEFPTEYRDRHEDSRSKLRTIPDGIRILKFILLLCKDYRPLRFFGWLGGGCVTLALFLGYLAHGNLHAWAPETFGTVGFAALTVIFVLAGVILDSLGRSRQELKRMLYLALPTTLPAPDGIVSDQGSARPQPSHLGI